MTSLLENIKTIDLEEWLTLATAPAPTKLKQGQTPDMKNCWVDEKPGSVITAPGYTKVGAIPSGLPVTFMIDYFKTSAGSQTFVVSDNATVWTTVDFQNFTSIITGLSSAFQLRGAVIRDKLWLTNGSDAVRVFDGTTVTVLSGSFGSVVIQDITYTAAASLYSPSSITIAYTGGAVAGSEVVTVVGPAISVQIQSGVSTATQVLAAINGSTAALALISAAITGTAGHAQVTASAVPLTGGTPNVPRGRYISYHDERVWLYHTSSNRSAVYFSALTDAAANIINPDDPAAWPVNNFLQISQGDADFGTGLLIYRGYLFLFKQYSIWRLVGYDEYTYSRVKTRASTGTRFSESLQILDSLVHLIGVDGIYVFDGEEAERISDIIDPATASQTSFGFNQLQQPNTNAQFWEVTATADWNAGTVPTDVAVANSITLVAADDSQSNFQAGVTQTNLDLTSNPGFIQLAHSGSGVSNPNILLGLVPVLSSQNTNIVGVISFVNDNDFTNYFGGQCTLQNASLFQIQFTFPVTYLISRINFIGLQLSTDTLFSFQDNTGASHLPSSANFGSALNSSQWDISGASIGATPTNVVFNFTPFTATALTLSIYPVSVGGTAKFTEAQAVQTAFDTTGKFTSKKLDLGLTPVSLGTFSATETLNGETTAYFTQSSSDGITWDAEVAVVNGAAIGSTPRRYLRWGVNLTSDGLNTPQIDAAYLPSVYISAIHNTGGSIFAWGPFESDRSQFGQVITYYYRTATTVVGISSATWNLIVPGGVLSTPVAQQYVQFRIEISGGDSTHLPVVTNVTINWVIGNGIQPQTLQNVASTYWRNRYWLSAAGPGATANNTILIRGKKTFGSPWMLKDWSLLSFTRFQDSLYGGSSTDGSILQLDTGYSKNGAAMDSYFQTGDFVFGGFTANLSELLVEAQRLGPWDLEIGISVDGGNTFVDNDFNLATSTYDNNYIKRINVSYTTTRFRLRFRTNGVDTPFQVHRCIAFYRLDPERGSIRGDYM